MNKFSTVYIGIDTCIGEVKSSLKSATLYTTVQIPNATTQHVQCTLQHK